MEKVLVENMEPQAMGLPERGNPQGLYPTSEVPIQTQVNMAATLSDYTKRGHSGRNGYC